MSEVSLNHELIKDFLTTAKAPGEYEVLERLDNIIEETKKIRVYQAHEGYSP
jgi:hypothetical protein